MITLDRHTYFIVTAKMIYFGFKFHKEIDSHNEEWINLKTGNTFKINKDSDFIPQKELLNMLDNAGILFKDFIDL